MTLDQVDLASRATSLTQSQATAQPSQSIAAGDLAVCDREPIHIPGSIQPHGVLLCVDPRNLKIVQASANAADAARLPIGQIVGASLREIGSDALAQALRKSMDDARLDAGPQFLISAVFRSAPDLVFDVTAHRRGGLVLLEFEPSDSGSDLAFRTAYGLVRDVIVTLQNAQTVEQIARVAADEVRKLTHFDRVLVYRFEQDWSGTTVGESLNGDAYAPYLGLRFPASDIPRQARELYRLNRLRLIVDASYRPVPLVPPMNPLSGTPTDLSFATLRSVSPIHCEYLRNMGAAASMSISIIIGGKLWGLIACHHRTPMRVPFEVRTACEFLGQIVSLQLEAREHDAENEHRVQLKIIQTRLLAAMAQATDFTVALQEAGEQLLTLMNATGAAILSSDICRTVGTTPDEPLIRRLADDLGARQDSDLFYTASLARSFPDAASQLDRAAGIVAISISKLHRSYLIWFRPEVIATVKWAGDPRKPPAEPGTELLHPRKSFELWKETIRGRCADWRASELAAAEELRSAIVGIVLRRAEELAALNAELRRSNAELEAFSYSVSHDLRAPFRHIVGYSELLKESLSPDVTGAQQRYLGTIVESAQYAGKLVDGLLSFSQMGRSSLAIQPVDMNRLVEEVRAEVDQEEARGRGIEWHVAQLPRVNGDIMMLRSVLRNLLSNAAKYTRQQPHPRIEVGVAQAREVQSPPRPIPPDATIFFIRDNGIGFDMAYVDKLFGVFQRLHRMEEFEGTGIGLANVKRIIERHGGHAWAHSAPGAGAVFYFSLPPSDAGTGVEKTV